MECKKAQDRLITEYVDHELGCKERSEVEQHLKGCPDCRGFLEAVQKNSVASFKEGRELQPDGIVWEKIRERIEAEQAKPESWFGRLADLLEPLWRVHQPIFRTAFVTAMILVVVVMAQWPSGHMVDPAYAYLSEQMTVMNGLQAGNTELLNGDLKDYTGVLEEMDR
jgi:anti-sigma factor RsiW